MKIEELNIIALATPLFFVAFVLEWAITKWRKKQFYRWTDTISDLSTGLIFSIVSVAVVAVALIVYEALRASFSIQSLFGANALPVDSVLVWVGTLIAVDFLYYWFHRATHEVRLLWAFHVTHHSSEEFNLSVALRQCCWQRILEYPFLLPLAFVGVPWYIVLTSHGVLKIYQFWVHNRWMGKLGWLEAFMLTPSQHRVHHARDPRYIDRNHGGIFIIWDRLFGTFAEEIEEPHYGLAKPLDSWNPLRANLHVFGEMWSDMRRTRRWRDRLRIPFASPGWKPEDLGGFQAAPDVAPDYKKYDTQPAGMLRVYTIAQFTAAVVGGLLFLRLARAGQTDLWLLFLFGVGLVASLGCVGCLLDRSANTIWYESVRLIAIGGAVVMLASVGILTWIVTGGVVFFCVASLVWVWSERNRIVHPALST